MRSRSPIPHLAVSVLLFGSALLALGCGEESDYETVGVTTPEFATDGPILTMAQWRNRVGRVCREAMTEVGAVSTHLAKDLDSVPAGGDEAAISRMAFEASRPVIEEQLAHLAALAAATRDRGRVPGLRRHADGRAALERPDRAHDR
jgi:hypothetical protein